MKITNRELFADWQRAKYPEGTRVKVTMAPGDPNPVPDGSVGTVDHVDDTGQLWVKFENGRQLGISEEYGDQIEYA